MTFAYKVDAYEAVEHGNDDPTLPKYDLSFGGRRAFCKEQYADLGELLDFDHFILLLLLRNGIVKRSKFDKGEGKDGRDYVLIVPCVFEQMLLTKIVI